MSFKLAVSALAFGCLFALVPGCAADSTSDADADADAEESAASADELNARTKAIVGSYQGQSGSVPRFKGLVLKADGSFFADVDSGIRCVRAPCPSGARLEGKFTATKSYLRLTAKTPGGDGAQYYGRYAYKLAGDKLTLSQRAMGDWENTLVKQASYCQVADDCHGQGMIVPMCIGEFTCSYNASSSSKQCGFKCGVTPAGIWPSNATKLVAQSSGGFMPPPPPGSNCGGAQSKYTLDTASGKLDWETCPWVDMDTPRILQTGSKVLTAAERAKVDQAMNGLKIASNSPCGADKPLLRVTVSTPSGDKTYTDSFYSCSGEGPFVDNIGGVFTALREIAQ